jgi:Protein of unknown function (DUF2958)
MKLLTQEQKRQMGANGAANAERSARDGETIDFQPVVELFCPWGEAIWLLTELDPEDLDIAFGLCDLGMGFPELGSDRISELENIRGPGGLRIECDLHFTPEKTLSAYADEARRLGCIQA